MYIQNTSARDIRDTINARDVLIPALASCVHVRDSIGGILLRRYRELRATEPPPVIAYMRAVYVLETGNITSWTRGGGRIRSLDIGTGVGRSATATGSEANISDVADLEVIETNPPQE